MKVVCHIGNPKALSTSIQDLLVKSEGEDYVYLGFRPSKKKEEWYKDSVIAELLNFDLRYCLSFEFEKKVAFYTSYINGNVKNCTLNGKDLWISSENLSMKFIMEDIDPVEKFKRLQSILPDGTTFIVIFRNIFESIRSIYFEYLKQGYAKNFEYFSDETYLFRKSNYLSSLLPGNYISLIKNNLAGNNELKWHFLFNEEEMMKKSLLNFLSSFRKNLSFKELPHKNISLNKGISGELKQLNIDNPIELDATGLMENHRALFHINSSKDKIFDEHIWSKLRKQKYNRQSIVKAKLENEIQFKLSSNLCEYINDIYYSDKELLESHANSSTINSYNDLWVDIRNTK